MDEKTYTDVKGYIEYRTTKYWETNAIKLKAQIKVKQAIFGWLSNPTSENIHDNLLHLKN